MRSSWFTSPFEGADSCTLKKHKSSLLNGSSACVFSCLFGMVASAVSSMVMFGVHMGVVSIVDDTMSVGFTAIGAKRVELGIRIYRPAPVTDPDDGNQE